MYLLLNYHFLKIILLIHVFILGDINLNACQFKQWLIICLKTKNSKFKSVIIMGFAVINYFFYDIFNHNLILID
jgi:hypothetical protein